MGPYLSDGLEKGECSAKPQPVLEYISTNTVRSYCYCWPDKRRDAARRQEVVGVILWLLPLNAERLSNFTEGAHQRALVSHSYEHCWDISNHYEDILNFAEAYPNH